MLTPKVSESPELKQRSNENAVASRPVEVLRSLKLCLESLEARGITHLGISNDALRILETLPARLWTPSPESPAATFPAAASVADSPPESPGREPRNDKALVPAGVTPAEKLASLKARAAAWKPARDLGTLRDTMVFAVGNPQADLMLIGEAPGADEETQREPFVGKAGQLLTKILKAMGLERRDVYISNICKFRPAMPNQGRGNRKPTSEEMTACRPLVMAEIEVVRPRAIVALGASAAESLLGIVEPVSRMRSRFHDLGGVPVMVTYHPSYLLRNEALSERRKVWEDMLLVMEKLGMPISEKQREFFVNR